MYVLIFYLQRITCIFWKNQRFTAFDKGLRYDFKPVKDSNVYFTFNTYNKASILHESFPAWHIIIFSDFFYKVLISNTAVVYAKKMRK